MRRVEAIKSIHYPKRRKKGTVRKNFGIQEPIRKNMYDVVKENFQIAERVRILHI